MLIKVPLKKPYKRSRIVISKLNAAQNAYLNWKQYSTVVNALRNFKMNDRRPVNCTSAQYLRSQIRRSTDIILMMMIWVTWIFTNFPEQRDNVNLYVQASNYPELFYGIFPTISFEAFCPFARWVVRAVEDLCAMVWWWVTRENVQAGNAYSCPQNQVFWG